MSHCTIASIRAGGTLGDFAAANVGEDGSYENVSERSRDPIRRDMARVEAFARLRLELTRAFAAPDDSYLPLTAADIIARNRA